MGTGGRIIWSVALTATAACQSRYFRTTLAGREYPAGYDRNGDGITDIQAIQNNLDPADPTLASQDPDGDGLNNLWEIKLGFNPRNADSASSKYDGKFAGNNVNDCQEDLVGDGIPLCWKIKNDIDPTKGNRSLTDADGDSYSDLEEYLAGTDPKAANSRPAGGTPDANGNLPGVLTLKGVTNSYSSTTTVTGTMSYCATGEQVLLSASKQKPSADDPGFVDCSTAADALTGVLPSSTTGGQTMYAWRKISAGVVDTPLAATILYAPRATSGGLDVQQAGDRTLSIGLVPPAGAHYGSVKLLRFAEADCSSKTMTSAGSTEVSVGIGDALVTQSGLSYGTPYCYKVFWTDTSGNVVTAHGGYDAVAPAAGNISISGFETKTIKFSHTPPTDTRYGRLIVRRFDTAACSTKTQLEGTAVAMGKTATTYSDTGLSLSTPYCYRVFWADIFGNSVGTTLNYDGDGPGAGTFSISGYAWKTINLSWTAPTAANVPVAAGISNVEIYRHEAATCSDKTQADGTKLPLTAAATSFSDDGDPDGAGPLTGALGYNKAYCYKIYWLDAFGNSDSTTDRYLGVGPAGGDLELVAMKADSIELSIIRPTPAPASTKLDRYTGQTCSGSATTKLSSTNIAATQSYSDSSSQGSFAINQYYCYQATWSDTFGNSTTDSVVAEYFPPQSSASPIDDTLLTLTSNVAGTVTYNAVLGSRFYGSQPTLKPLMGSDGGKVTSNGTVTSVDSDVPGLSYIDTNCSGATKPYFCPGTSNASGSPSITVTAPGELLWDYGRFDQGVYDIRTLSYLNVPQTPSNLSYYSAPYKTGVITSNLGQEISVLVDGSLVSTNFASLSTMHLYQPKIALNENLSTETKQIYGIAYQSNQNTINQYIGKVVVDRANSEDATTGQARVVFSATSGNTVDATYLLGDPGSPANSDSLAIASTDSSSPAWLVASSALDGQSKTLRLARVVTSNDSGTTANAGTIIRFPSPVTSTVDTPTFSSIAMTGAFADKPASGSTINRHGLAFAATVGSTKGVFLSKIRSTPTSATDLSAFPSSYFDATGYYPADPTSGDAAPVTNILNYAVPVQITPSVSGTVSDSSLVQLVVANESGTNFFYLGWRDNQSMKGKFAKVLADGNVTPSRTQSTAIESIRYNDVGDEITYLRPGASRGRGTFMIAAGQDTASNPILGVIYSPNITNNTTGKECRFAAYSFNSSTSTLTRVKTSGAVDTYATLVNNINTTCKFPQLFWNNSSKKFMAVWVEETTSGEGVTKYAEFTTTTSPGLSISPTTLSPVTVTSARASNTYICGLSSTYSPATASNKVHRIAISTIEAVDCTSDATAKITFDMYKPSR